MANTNLIEQEVLHEIAMSIGISLDLDEMLHECLPIFVRGLGCCTAAVLLQDEECGFFAPKCILPHAAMRNRGLHLAMAKAIDLSTSAQALPVPLIASAEQQLYYAWPLKSIGILLLGRGSEFEYPLYMEVAPLAEKLAFAVQACEQYQSLRLAEQAMAKAKDDAESANRAKSYFLATMSHEIRTPLNAVINLSELLAETRLNDQQRHLLDGICEGGRALLQLVNDVLDFSKIEAGKLEIMPTPFNLRLLLDGLADLYGKQASEKGLALEFNLDAQLPAMVESDPARVRQIMQNLLSNAIKFTDHGFVRVSVSPEPNEASPELCRFTVQDSGIGIAQEHLGSLFQEFHQLDSGLDRRFGGTGLGLAIVARLVEHMGGTLGVESRLGDGSCFWFTLPMPSVNPQWVVPPLQPLTPTPGRILLVEDSPTNQIVACALLEKLGCQVEAVNTGLAALTRVQQVPFDLVLMDISMPGMDGMEATRQIRALGGEFSQLPIVAMTAHAFAQDRASCLAAGMNDYLSKPLQRERLHEVVACWLQPRQESNPALPVAEMAVTAPQGEPTAMAQPILELSTLQTLQAETTPEVLQQVVALYIQELEEHRLALSAAVTAADEMQSAAHAHAIKSSSGALGATALYQAAAELEQAYRQGQAELAASLYQPLPGLIAQTQASLQHHFLRCTTEKN